MKMERSVGIRNGKNRSDAGGADADINDDDDDDDNADINDNDINDNDADNEAEHEEPKKRTHFLIFKNRPLFPGGLTYPD